MKLGKTVLAALVLLALGTYLWLVEREAIRREGETTKLLEIEPEHVSEVRLTKPDESILLRRTGEGWRIEEPLSTRADGSAVENLVRAIAEAELKKTLDTPESLTTYGLDPPAVTVTLETDTAETTVIRVGKTSPVGFSTYVAVEGREGIALVPSSVHSGMQKTVEELRDKVILDFDDGAVRAIDIEAPTPGESVRLERAPGAAWTIVEPRALETDEDEIRNFFSSLRGLRAQRFLDDPPPLAELGLDPPTRRIVLETDGEPLELLVGIERERDDANELFLKRRDRGVVYAIGSWSGRSLAKTSMDFRDKTVLEIDRDAVRRLEISRADGETFALVRTAEGASDAESAWTVEGADRAQVRGHRIVQLLGDLGELEGFEVVGESPETVGEVHLDEPDVRYRVLGVDGALLGEVSLVRDPADEESGYAASSTSPTVVRIRGYRMTHLDKTRADFLDEPGAAEGGIPPGEAASPAAEPEVAEPEVVIDETG